MYCTYCNFDNNSDNKFCESCGKLLDKTLADTQPIRRQVSGNKNNKQSKNELVRTSPFKTALAIFLGLAILGALFIPFVRTVFDTISDNSGIISTNNIPQDLEMAIEERAVNWFQMRNTPYQNIRYEIVSNNGTFATVHVLVDLRPNQESGWIEHETQAECTKVGEQWNCSHNSFDVSQAVIARQQQAQQAAKAQEEGAYRDLADGIRIEFGNFEESMKDVDIVEIPLTVINDTGKTKEICLTGNVVWQRPDASINIQGYRNERSAYPDWANCRLSLDPNSEENIIIGADIPLSQDADIYEVEIRLYWPGVEMRSINFGELATWRWKRPE